MKQFMNKMLINHILFIGPIENLKHFVKRRQVKTIKFNLISMKKTTIQVNPVLSRKKFHAKQICVLSSAMKLAGHLANNNSVKFPQAAVEL